MQLLENPGLSDHHVLHIVVNVGTPKSEPTGILCFNAHFGTDAREHPKPPGAYAAFIRCSGAKVVCMQECD
jgi:hypothetical protein